MTPENKAGPMKKLLYALLGIVVLFVVAVLVGPGLIDWKPRLAAAVRSSTGRELRIDGPFSVSLVPKVRVSASGIHLANAPGMAESDMLSVDSLTLEAELLPLFGKRVVVDTLVIKNPAVNLEVDKAGKPNWVFSPPGASEIAAPKEKPEGGGGMLGGVELGDVRIEQGRLAYRDATTGQALAAKDVTLDVKMANSASPLALKGQMTLNNEPVSAELAIDTLDRLARGQQAKLKLAVNTKHLTAGFDGAAQQQPAPGLTGTFDLAVGSVGNLLAWLQQPLPTTEPDPGPLKIHAVFASDGAKSTLSDGTITGTALNAKVTGSFDASGPVAKLTAAVESGALDIDRYLPPQARQQPQAPRPAGAASPPADLFAGVSDQPFDLGALRKTDADIKISVAGVKAMGYELGRVAFTTTAKGGVVTAELAELALYGGTVKGTAKLDASGNALGLDTTLIIDHVTVDKPVRQATGAATMNGVVAAMLAVKAAGKSPRELATSAQGRLTVDLGGVTVANAATQGISGLKLDLTLPGTDQPTSLKATLVYRGEHLAVDANVAPLRQLLAGGRFPAKLALDSPLLTLHYDGAVQREPRPGLDGTLDLAMPSVGKLAAWLGEPLDSHQPDPGPLRLHAVLTDDGTKLTLKEATLAGTELNAKANGSVDMSGPIVKIAGTVESGVLDIDRYLPPTAQTPAKPQSGAQAPSSDLLAGVSDAPFHLDALRTSDVDVKIAVAGVKIMGYELGRVAFTAVAKGGALSADLAELALYGGSAKGTVKLDASGSALVLDTNLAIDHVKVDDPVKRATGEPLMTGVVSATLNAKGAGKSPRALVESVQGHFVLDLGGMTAANAATQGISGLKLDLTLPGADKATLLKANLVYRGEPLGLDASVAPLRQLIAGTRFPTKLALGSPLVTLRYDGAVQREPSPAIDGTLDLDVPSVGKLAAWAGEPLDAKQPDPGPLKLHAVLANDGAKLALKEATITGKAIKATAQASLDNSQKVAAFDAKIDVQQADLNAYLPPPEKATPARPAPPTAWSTEKFELASLHEAAGQAEIDLAAVRYRELDITKGQIRITLSNGVLKLATDKLALAQGTIDAAAAMDASAAALKLDYHAAAANVQARPLLETFANSDRLGGTIVFETTGKGSGVNEKELIQSLNGTGTFKVTDGAIYGINLAKALREVGSLGLGDSPTEKTDFAELDGTFTIKDGILANRDLKMLAPLFRVTGAGTISLPPKTVDYDLEAKLVATTQGQGGKDALEGVQIPVKVTGSWSSPSYKIDWKSVISGMASDPERLKNLPANFGDAAKGLGLGNILKPAPQGPQPGAQAPPAGDQGQPAKKPLFQLPKELFGK
jgi:AsmA protein